MREENIIHTLFPFIDNVLYYDYPYIDKISDIENMKYKDFVEANMNMIEVWDSGVENLGFHKYQDKKEVLAVRFSGIVSFDDPSFSKQTYENGCVVVKNGDDKIQVVKPDVFLKSFPQTK